MKKKNEDIRKLQENEHINRKEFESMIDNRYRNIYQNEIKEVEKELSDFRFTVSECLDEISNIIGQQSLNNEQNSRMKTLIKNLKSQCNQNYQ
ncbi:hypothetical protein ACFFUE_05195 [Bergeyella porcorum]|uniref:hypothetical protein n=1 Tax=Bergeyella porcorum TaxID=1735111 RepID=UPI0035ED0C3F